MPSSLRALAAVVSAAFLTACAANAPAPRKTPAPTVVRVAFERNFMKSCLAGVKGTAGTAYCLCTRDALDDAFSDKELPQVTPADPRVLHATHGCAAKFGLPITPGH